MQSFSSHSLAAGISKADVVIACQDRYVVAIVYQPGKMKAPICLGKGSLKRGAVILEMAQKYQVPIVENPMLAKKLFFETDSGAYIGVEFYRDLALILSKIPLEKL